MATTSWVCFTAFVLHVTCSGLILMPGLFTAASASPVSLRPSTLSGVSPLLKMTHLSPALLQAVSHRRRTYSSSVDEEPSYSSPLLLVDPAASNDSPGSEEIVDDVDGDEVYNPLDDLYFTQLVEDMARQLKNSRRHRFNLRQKRFSYEKEEEEEPRRHPTFSQNVVAPVKLQDYFGSAAESMKAMKRALGLLMSLNFRNQEPRPRLALVNRYPGEASFPAEVGSGEGMREAGGSKRHRPHGLLRWGR